MAVEPPTIVAPVVETSTMMLTVASESRKASVSLQSIGDRVTSVYTAAIGDTDELGECVALLPDETVETAMAQTSTLTETDVGIATCHISTVDTGVKGLPPPLIQQEADDFWCALLGSPPRGVIFRHTFSTASCMVGQAHVAGQVPLHVPRAGGRAASRARAHDTRLRGGLARRSVLHAALRASARIARGRAQHCARQTPRLPHLVRRRSFGAHWHDRAQEHVLIPKMWRLLRSDYSQLAQVAVPMIMHCLTLPSGPEALWATVVDDMTNQEWNVRFKAGRFALSSEGF